MRPGHPNAKVFAALPTMKRMRSDLRAAGIPTDTGLCFHSLRHTFCTRLVKSGCRLKAAQQLMRHSTVELTAKVYTHLGIIDTADALQGLSLPKQATEGRATGTDDLSISKAHQMAHQTTCENLPFVSSTCVNNLLASESPSNAKTTMDGQETPMDGDKNNTAGDGTRTHNSQLGRLALCH